MLDLFNIHIGTNPIHIIIGIIILAIILKLLGKVFKVILVVGIIVFVLYKINGLSIIHSVVRMINSYLT